MVIDLFSEDVLPNFLLDVHVSYQGGKQRIASDIINFIKPAKDKIFYDICCGSGAVSLELINRGFPQKNIVMVDQGPWGLFWQSVSDGSFDLNRFKIICDNIPTDKNKIKSHVEELGRQTVNDDVVYIYLILQAASFGSKAIWIEGNKWQNCSFRDYWQPTDYSIRRSPVNPMMPMKETLYKRIAAIIEHIKGIEAVCDNAMNIIIKDNSIVYCDPPYRNTTLYGHTLNIQDFITKLPTNSKCYVSEGLSLSDNSMQISGKRSKGGISGNRNKFNQEWISVLK